MTWLAHAGPDASSAEVLRDRFRDVTFSTLIGTGVTASVQGLFVGLAFWTLGLSNALFWGVVTVIVAILPVVGSKRLQDLDGFGSSGNNCPEVRRLLPEAEHDLVPGFADKAPGTEFIGPEFRELRTAESLRFIG